jgi:putative SOS response-associated peptidase YedK
MQASSPSGGGRQHRPLTPWESHTICYSAAIWSDFRRYERLGGVLDIHAFVKTFYELGRKGTFPQLVPRAVRDAFTQPQNDGEETVRNAVLDAYRATALVYERIIAEQTERLAKAEAALARKPTKTAEKEKSAATKKIEANRAKLAKLGEHAAGDGWGRIWPGHYAPVLVHDRESGERRIIPMRYRARPIGWTRHDEKLKNGCYNARKTSLKTTWRGIFGYGHGVVVASRFYESVYLHENQQRQLAPGEKEQNIEIVFSPRPAQEMFLAVIYRYVEGDEDERGFYGFAAVTRDPPPEVLAAGHPRCVIPIKPDNLDAWLQPDAKNLSPMFEILDDPIDAYYEHQLVEEREPEESEP